MLSEVLSDRAVPHRASPSKRRVTDVTLGERSVARGSNNA
jgi:hypothetical protein